MPSNVIISTQNIQSLVSEKTMTDKPDYIEQIQAGLELLEEKQIYFNGFTITITGPDVLIILAKNNKQVAVLNTSHTIAKTLAELLTNMVTSFEKDKNVHVYTLADLDQSDVKSETEKKEGVSK